MAVKLQLRRGTSAEWSSANPVLAEGEIGIDTDELKGKIGDGATAWNSLAFGFEGSPGAQGDPGPGVPAGGTTGQVLQKASGDDFDTEWGSPAGSGTVTSVAMSVPTGLSVSGSPITGSGTLAVTWTAGYQGYTSAEATKLAGIETGATADQTAGEIETAYNSQVAQVSAGEKTAGTETAIRRFSPKDVADMAGTHGGGGSTYGLGFEAEQQAYYDALAADGAATEPKFRYSIALASLLLGLEDSGILAKLDFLHLFANAGEKNAYYNVLDPTQVATKTGTLTFTANAGLTGDGSSGYLALGFSRNDLTQFTQDSAHIGFWSLTDAQETGDVISAGGNLILNPRDSGNFHCRINSATNVTAAVTTSIGYFVGNRSSSTAIELYQNGVALTPSGAATSAALNTSAFEVFRYSGQYTTRQIALVHGGASLTASEVATFYAYLDAFLDGIGAI